MNRRNFILGLPFLSCSKRSIDNIFNDDNLVIMREEEPTPILISNTDSNFI